jgi:protein involved in polysaccharide export with SLBB domain
VASPAQLQEYPEDEAQIPDSGDVQLPYFRLDTVQLIGRNPSEIQDLIQQFVEELTMLSRNLDALETFEDEQIITVP